LFADWSVPDLPPWGSEALKQFPVAAVLIIAGVIFYRYIIKEHGKHLASKDAEIERLVEEKKSCRSCL
jgi:hypothetical protein